MNEFSDAGSIPAISTNVITVRTREGNIYVFSYGFVLHVELGTTSVNGG